MLPTGYAFNHDGTCLYFAPCRYSSRRRWGSSCRSPAIGTARDHAVTSKGGAGVAGSAIVVLASTLEATGTIPVAASAIILGVHRLLSSAFVPVNVLGNALATIVMAKLEGALDHGRLTAELEAGPA